MAVMTYSASLIICFLLCGACMPQAILSSTPSHVAHPNSNVEPASKKEPPGNLSKPTLAALRHGSIEFHAPDFASWRVSENSNLRARQRNKPNTLKRYRVRRTMETVMEDNWQGRDTLFKTNTSLRIDPPEQDTLISNAIPPVPHVDMDTRGYLTSIEPDGMGEDSFNSAQGSVDSNEITNTDGVRITTNTSGSSNTSSDGQPLDKHAGHIGHAENVAENDASSPASDSRSKGSTADTRDDVTTASDDPNQHKEKKDVNVSEGAADDSTRSAEKLHDDGNKRLVKNSSVQGSAQVSAQERRHDNRAPPPGGFVVQGIDPAPELKALTSAKNISNTPHVISPKVNKPKLHRQRGDGAPKVDGGGFNATKLSLTLQSQDDSVTALWTFESNDTRITGFLVTYRINNREHYDSSKLGKLVRSFTLHSLHEDEDYVICVHAMVNTTAVMDACAHWNVASMKMVVGIMAGTLFLVPCIIVVVWILVKDGQIRNKMTKDIEKSGAAYKKSLIAHDGSQHDIQRHVPHGGSQHEKHCHSQHGCSQRDNPCHAPHDGSQHDTHCLAPHSDLEVSDLIIDEGMRRSNEKVASSSPNYNCQHSAVNNADDSGPWKRQSQAESQMTYTLSSHPKTKNHTSTQAENHSMQTPKPPSSKLHHRVAQNSSADQSTSAVCTHDIHDTPTDGIKTLGASHSSIDLPISALVGSPRRPSDSRRLSEPWYPLLDQERVVERHSPLHIPPVLFDDKVVSKGQDGDEVAPL